MDALKSLQEQGFWRRLQERDASLWSREPEQQAAIANRLGWVTVHATMTERAPELREFAQEAQEGGYTHVVLLGMGGSSLAPEVFQETFGPGPGSPPLTVLDTTDPASILAIERSLDLPRTLFIVSSKSGTTIETMSLLRYFAARVRAARGDGGVLDNFVAITDPETPLSKQADQEGFRRCFLNPPDIGGRYSALSYFGLVPAAAIGLDIDRLLEGAQALDQPAAVELGATLGAMAREGRDKITFLPAPALRSFGAWAEQLLAESTGKQGKGLIPVDGEPAGPPEVYGNDRLFVRLRLAGQPDGLDSPVRAIQAAGHPVVTIEMNDVYGLGAEFRRWEIATAAAGALLGINPFDEPNVQESKDNTLAVLRESSRAEHVPDPPPLAAADGLSLYCDAETAEALGGAADGIGPMVARHFRRGRAGDYLATMAYFQRSEKHDRLLTRMRTALRDATRLATTVGYGPRFLHSTGQLHKGGPPTGVFLQLTADDPVDLPIPGEPAYGFSKLKQAQALGDLRALQSRGRPVVRVHLGAALDAGLERLADSLEAGLAAATPGRRD